MNANFLSNKTHPYIIAELSGNHNGDINRAFAIIEAAKKAGADAVKLQTYTADTMTLNHHSEDFIIKEGLWKGYQLYLLYEEAHTPWEWHEALFAKGREIGITVFSTPFDKTAVDFLESLNAPFYKIASFELTDLYLIKYVAKTKKPMIMSTGMANFEEIGDAVQVAKDNGCSEVILLHCISAYPTEAKDFNLRMLVSLKEKFKVNVGISDHTLGTTVAVVAVGLGATIIEKHVTLSRQEGGVDAAFSLEPTELKELCDRTKEAYQSLGHGQDERCSPEKKNLIFRRSIYPTKNISPGEQFSENNVRCIRPGFSLSPQYYEELLTKKSKRAILAGTRLTLGDLS